MSPAWDNLDDFLSPDDFAVSACFILADGREIAPVFGVFDDPTMNAETGEFDMNVSAPRFTCKASCVAAVKRNDAVHIEGERYEVDHDPQLDGTGMATVYLSRAPASRAVSGPSAFD